METWKPRSLSSKIVCAIVLVLVVCLGLNLWVTLKRVNAQAERAFSDKPRTMTDVALGSRVSNSEGGHAWEVSQRYAKTQGYNFTTPSHSPLNPADVPSPFDQRAFAAFEAHPDLAQYVERSKVNGRETMLFARPVVVTQDCLNCHTWKETSASTNGGKRELAALFSIEAPLDTLAANEKSNAGMLLAAGIVTLVVASGTVLIVLRRLVVCPLKLALQLANRIAANDLTDRLAIGTEDEIGQMGDALNQALTQMSGAIRSVADSAESVASASSQLSQSSQQITTDSQETTSQASAASSDTDQVNRSLQTAASGAEQMRATIQEIARNARESARVAGEAVHKASSTNETVSKLGKSSAEIGEVIKMISAVAGQTNLLALNATIEAARAGEAGKGFAVVANEVKELAKQTAKATDDINGKIAAIQSDTQGAVESIGSIREIINQINDISGTIASAVEQQTATADQMSKNLAEAARSSDAITKNISGVAHVAESTSSKAHESLRAATELAQMSTQLRELVGQFKVNGNGRQLSCRETSGDVLTGSTE
ncbi:MAG TPA: methyl-accepting chemotaxis protein [Candidatus Acidoferrales bacterium]|jgi:methyl-accepting chemotaxis protein|nr:methyl-accepting chemotaxis protein [Candidatus Acidoferrales bacterium]